MQTVFDTMCLALILAKTISESLIRGRSFRSVGGIQALIVKHGVIYYVCASNRPEIASKVATNNYFE